MHPALESGTQECLIDAIANTGFERCPPRMIGVSKFPDLDPEKGRGVLGGRGDLPPSSFPTIEKDTLARCSGGYGGI